jgi:pentatricopeptide repeat protein
VDAINLAEQLRSGINDEMLRAGYFRERLYMYQAMVKVCLHQGQLTEAWRFVERARSRALLDALSHTTVDLGATLSEEQLTQEQAQILELRLCTSKMASTTDDEVRSQTSQEIAIVEEGLNEFYLGIEKISPEYVALRRGEPVVWSDLQKYLGSPLGE